MPAKVRREEIIKRIESKGFKIVSIGNNMKDKSILVCKECHNEFETTPDHIWTEHTKSCGCTSRGRRKGTEEVSGDYFTILRKGAIRRGIKFDITIEYISNLLKKQNFKCKLSNMDIQTSYNRKKKEQTASLDRIDNTKGYVKGNVQWVHRDVNWMKQDFSQEYFLQICRYVALSEV